MLQKIYVPQFKMIVMPVVFWILLCTTAMAMDRPETSKTKSGDIVFQTNFESADARARWTSHSLASWVELPGRGKCLKVDVPNSELARKDNMIEVHPAFKGHSLPRLRGVMSPNKFNDEDLRILGQEWNANLIRWQMTTDWGAEYKNPQDYNLNLYDQWLDEELKDLDKVLVACRKYGIMAVIDLHSPPGGRRSNSDLVMLHESAYLDKFVSVWKRIAKRYKDNPAVWGYDLVNEPVMDGTSPEGMPDYLGAQTLAAKAIRAIDPKTPIIIAVDHWDSAEGFKYIDHPVDIPRVIYQVHMYWPSAFTHQGVSGRKTGPEYPGEIEGSKIDKDALRRHLAPVREFQLANNVHIYVGEFSAIRWAPNNSAWRYLRDCIDLFEEYGWDWSYHAYREWDGWSVEHNSDPNDHKPTTEQTMRKKLLLEWFGKNIKPEYNLKK